jgi:hypothetical protein
MAVRWMRPATSRGRARSDTASDVVGLVGEIARGGSGRFRECVPHRVGHSSRYGGIGWTRHRRQSASAAIGDAGEGEQHCVAGVRNTSIRRGDPVRSGASRTRRNSCSLRRACTRIPHNASLLGDLPALCDVGSRPAYHHCGNASVPSRLCGGATTLQRRFVRR